MHNLSVFNIQRLCVNDGPGVRTTVFLRGCTLQCPWCCNPEGIHIKGNAVYDKAKCLYPSNSVICKDCKKHGGTRELVDCPISAYELTYKNYSHEELLEDLLKDKKLYFNGGGITFSGGEPLVQIHTLVPVLEKLKEEHIHIAFETTLYVPKKLFELALNYVDYWIVDLKFQFGYYANKEFAIPSSAVFENLMILREFTAIENINYRMVVMHEASDNFEKMVAMLKEHAIKDIELLECHSLAESKYNQLGKTFKKFHAPTTEEIDMLKSLLIKESIKCQYTKL